jgi:hypothetical protein
MVYVRLTQDWTGGDGQWHPAGDLVDVDAATLSRLEADGIVADGPDTDWVGPTSSSETDWVDWNGPSGMGESESWAGPDA